MKDKPDWNGGYILVPSGNNTGLLRKKLVMMELKGTTEFVQVEAAITGFLYRL